MSAVRSVLDEVCYIGADSLHFGLLSSPSVSCFLSMHSRSKREMTSSTGLVFHAVYKSPSLPVWCEGAGSEKGRVRELPRAFPKTAQQQNVKSCKRFKTFYFYSTVKIGWRALTIYIIQLSFQLKKNGSQRLKDLHCLV